MNSIHSEIYTATCMIMMYSYLKYWRIKLPCFNQLVSSPRKRNDIQNSKTLPNRSNKSCYHVLYKTQKKMYCWNEWLWKKSKKNTGNLYAFGERPCLRQNFLGRNYKTGHSKPNLLPLYILKIFYIHTYKSRCVHNLNNHEKGIKHM